MNTLSELIGRCLAPEAKSHNKSRVETLSSPFPTNSEKKPAYQYEDEVFNYLLVNRDALGIKSVMKFTALLVDGAVELSDGRRLTLEIKFRMNWKKACQAEWQFRNFLKRDKKVTGSVVGGLVIFEEFAGDGWDKIAKSRFLENGWSAWYRENSEVEGFRLHLLRLRKGILESFPLSDAVKAKIDKLTGEEIDRLRIGLAAGPG